MLPEGWKKISLADAVRQKISYGIVQAGPHVDGGIPYIKSSDVRDDISLASLQRTSAEIHGKYIRSSVRPGDIIFSLRGNIGATCIVPSEISEANLTQGTARISCSQKVYPNFLIQELRTSPCIQQALNLSKGSTFKEISLESLRTLKIILPPLPEQKKIAAILSTWDRAIEGTEKLLANSQQQKKALMQQLLTGKKRLPGFTGEWKNVLLKDIALIKKGQALSSKDLMRGDYPVIAGGKTSPYKHKNFTHENVITVSASGAYAGYVSFHSYKIWASDCSVITSRSGNSISFIYFWLSYLQNKIFSLQSGGAQPHIYPRDLELLHIHCPPLPEQKAIAAVLSTADEEHAAIEADLALLRQEKKALMQQLLTGKRRVTVD